MGGPIGTDASGGGSWEVTTTSVEGDDAVGQPTTTDVSVSSSGTLAGSEWSRDDALVSLTAINTLLFAALLYCEVRD